MAVTQRRTVELRPWNAFENPAFPEGSWFVHFLMAHAGGGGAATMEARVQETGESLSSRLWSIEQMTYDTLVSLAGVGLEVRSVNLETFQRLQVADFSRQLTLASFATGGRGIASRDLAAFPWFLGAPRIQGLAAGFDVVTTDGGIGERSNMLASGYYWGPAARNAPGGPQRPPTGLFGP